MATASIPERRAPSAQGDFGRPPAFKPNRQLFIEGLVADLCVAIRDVEKRRDERDSEEKSLARFRRETAAKKAIVDAFMEAGS